MPFPRLGDGSEAGGLVTVVRQLSVAQSLDEIMSVVAHAVRTLLHADGATFVLRDGDRCLYAEEDAVSPLWKGRRFPMNSCISGWCMLNRQPAAIGDIYKDPRIPADAYRPTFVRSLAMVPVGAEEPVAALGAYWSEVRDIRPEELERLQSIASAASLAVAYVQLQKTGASGQRRAKAAPAETTGRPAGNRPRWSLKDSIAHLRREGLRRNSLEAYAFAVFCVAIATLIRWGVDELGLAGLSFFSTFYPAVLLSVLAGGPRAGMVAAALGGLSAYWMFMPPEHEFAPLTASSAVNLSLYVAASGLIILIVGRYQRAVLRLTEEDARHFTLAREQRHRVQNAIAVVEAIVRQSLRDDPTRALTISQRVRAGLADVDMRERRGEAPITPRELLTAALQAFDLERFSLEGPDAIPLPPEARSILALAAHELATNALKYGALSVPEGRVAVDWQAEGGRVTVRWREAGGPLVKAPQRLGYGTRLLRRLLEASDGSIVTDFRPTGLAAEITLPLHARRRR